jgi:hypothetical protein
VLGDAFVEVLGWNLRAAISGAASNLPDRGPGKCRPNAPQDDHVAPIFHFQLSPGRPSLPVADRFRQDELSFARHSCPVHARLA